MQWMVDLPWSEVGLFTGGCTITVPPSCVQEFSRIGMLCLWLWENSFFDLSLKLHYVAIQMICAPAMLTPTHATVSSVVKQRLERFFEGD